MGWYERAERARRDGAFFAAKRRSAHWCSRFGGLSVASRSCDGAPVSPTTRRCYLHVGLPKTGTSYLQSVIWASRAALAAQGVGLPMERRVDHFHVTLALRGLLRSEMDAPGAFTALERLAESAANLASPAILVTQESLAPATPAQAEQLINLLPGYEVARRGHRPRPRSPDPFRVAATHPGAAGAQLPRVPRRGRRPRSAGP